MPEVDIHIPVHNCEQFFRKTLDSILAQTWQDWRCIIVNDLSTDNTAAIAQEYVDRDKRFVLHHLDPATRRPYPYVRNIALSLSTAKWVAPLDGDDWWEPWKLERQLAALEQAGPGKLLCATGWTGWNNGVITGHYHGATSEQVAEKWPVHCMFAHDAVLMDRESVMKLGGYDETMQQAEDWDLWFRMFHAYGSDICVMIEDCAVYYRRHDTNMTNKRLHALHYDWRCARRSLKYYLWEKHDLRGARFLLDFWINKSMLAYREANQLRGAAGWSLLAVVSAPWKKARWVQAWQVCKAWLFTRPAPAVTAPAKTSDPAP